MRDADVGGTDHRLTDIRGATPRQGPNNLIRPFVRFSRIEAASGIVLFLAAFGALIWANSGFSQTYFGILEERFTLDLFGIHLSEPVRLLVNDGLMAIFFFVVALEIKRELVLGDLRDRRAATLPIMAAVGGMVVPVAIYLALNSGGSGESLRGWGIPMATDIAFALGVLALLGRRVPPGAKLFLLAVAIVDDVGAIAAIALFYSDDISAGYLAAAAAGLAVMWAAGRMNVRAMWFYVPLGIVIWYHTLNSGIHATFAGVAIGLLTPAHPYYTAKELHSRARHILNRPAGPIEDRETRRHAEYEALLLADVARETVSPLNRLEHKLAPWTSFLIVPLFALVNAGVDFRHVGLADALGSPVTLGVVLGLVVGKLGGISLFTLAAVRLGLGRLPPGIGWPHVIGMAAVAGIGFTVSMFVTGLAFTDPALADLAKVGIFAAAVLAGAIGAAILLLARRETAPVTPRRAPGSARGRVR